MGKYDDAVKYLKKFDTEDILLGPIAMGAQGDAQLELGKKDKARDLYKQAYKLNDNNLTTPVFMMKAAALLESSNKNDEALQLYETIRQKYPTSNEGRSIDKYIARVKSKMNG
jgi:TolA-binding protein